MSVSLSFSSSTSSSAAFLTTVNTVTLTFTVILGLAQGFHTGGPKYSCRNLVPGHSNGTQPGPPPYNLRVSSSVLVPGGSTTVTLESTGDFPFKGFLCAVSELEDADKNSVGRVSFSSASSSPSSSSNIAPITCSRSTPDTAMTHTNSEEKYRVDFDWTAPSTASSGQQFKLRCTCVMNFFRCWTDLKLDLVIGTSSSDSAGPKPSSGPGTTTVGDNNSRIIGANSNNNNNDSNNGDSGVSGSSFDLDFGFRNIPTSSLPLRPGNNIQNNDPISLPNNAIASRVDNPFNSQVDDAMQRINSNPPSQENDIPAVPTNRIPASPIANIPAILSNNVPNQFTDNNIGLSLDTSLAFVPFTSNDNSVNPVGSGFILIPTSFQNQANADAGFLTDRLNQIGGSLISEIPNPQDNAQDLGSPSQLNTFRLSPSGLNQFDIFQNNPIEFSHSSVGNTGPSRVRSRPSHDRINVANNDLRRQIIPRNSQGRRSSDSNLLDQNLVRRDELFTNPQETFSGLGGFESPTRFFMTPGALRRFRQRNSLV
ncbi:hypothetical protein RRG08_003682 [Elysia crispata]|uniref:Reelin domain-containing protein n=1 Tax=Elysia crispata TaxID=231223 RepID=A0AAE1AWF7_9GAST|nr:hypothetical protein RRG08_003682 [Elysia crispata]